MQVTRREFLKTGSLVAAFAVPGAKYAFADENAKKSIPTHYFEISKEGKFFFTFDKAEMGQGVIMGQTTLFGEEADINPVDLNTRVAGVDSRYATMMGHQVTGGSTSTADRWMVLRNAGAEVRALMIKAAAQKWNISEKELKTENGHVLNGKGERLHYGELVQIASGLQLSTTPALKKRAEFRYIGKDGLPQPDAYPKSTGTNEFGIDLKLPHMKIAVIERSPVFGGKLKSFDATEAKKVPGVDSIMEVPTGVAIVCDRYWQALKARRVLKIEWDSGKNAKLSSAQIMKDYREKMKSSSGSEVESRGDLDSAFEGADLVVEAEYDLPYLAHSTMEPMNCTVDATKDVCEVYSSTQAPSLVRNGVAYALGISRDKVLVKPAKYLGGGFGRRSTIDYSVEAALLSKEVGKPIKVIWSREDDTRHSPMRPISTHAMKGALKDGKISAWQHKLGCESIMQQVMPRWLPLMAPGWLPRFVGSTLGGAAGLAMRVMNFSPTTAEGAIIDYKVDNFSVHHYRLGLNIPLHFWRSVGHSYTGFVVESFMDELAHQAKKDPYTFRRDLLPEESRIRATLDKVVEISGWHDSREAGHIGHVEHAGHGRGIACHTSFGSYVSQVADVTVEGEQIKVKKVFCVVDCGLAVNPDMIRKQIESGITYGLSAALSGEITLKDGAIEQGNFDTYPPVRQTEMPEVVVHVIESSEAPTGVGEPGLPPIAAAVANAIFSASGMRLRSLPLRIGIGDA